MFYTQVVKVSHLTTKLVLVAPPIVHSTNQQSLEVGVEDPMEFQEEVT